jgi:hypothetical protein
MMKAFDELGALTASNWTKLGGHHDAFAEAATSALAESGVLRTVSVQEIIEWLASSRDLPEQYGKEFGQPPVNVYIAEKFFVQVLFWLDSTTAVHEHSFGGAFGVLSGSSVHTQYRFGLQNAPSPEFRLGNLRFISSELLYKGDLRPIHPGDSFIHALFHLDRPSVSVVVRTKWLNVTQYTYLKPHVAFDPFYAKQPFGIWMRMMDSLNALRSDDFWSFGANLIEKRNALVTFNVLVRAYQISKEHPQKWQQMFEQASQLHGREMIELSLASIKESERDRKLTRLRAVVHKPDYRFLLALLMNVPERNTLLTLVSQQFKTQQPESLVMQWITEMSDAGLFLTRFEPELLDTIELALLHNSYEEARAVILSSVAESPLRDEEKMKKLWKKAHSLPFFQPLYGAVA